MLLEQKLFAIMGGMLISPMVVYAIGEKFIGGGVYNAGNYGIGLALARAKRLSLVRRPRPRVAYLSTKGEPREIKFIGDALTQEVERWKKGYDDPTFQFIPQDSVLWTAQAQMYLLSGMKKGDSLESFTWSDPGFFRKSDYPEEAKKLSEKFKKELKEGKLTADKEVGNLLKTECKEVLESWYKNEVNEERYKKAKQWCIFQKPERVKEVYEFQEKSGGCKFMVTQPYSVDEGFFPWEAVDSLIDVEYFKYFTGDMRRVHDRGWGKGPNSDWYLDKIKETCQKNKDKIVPFYYDSRGSSGVVGVTHPFWFPVSNSETDLVDTKKWDAFYKHKRPNV